MNTRLRNPAWFLFGCMPLVMLLAVSAAPRCTAAEETAPADKEEAPAEPERHAYKLGDFRIRNFRPVEREKVNLTFTVWVEVADGRQDRFDRVWESREHRIRNQIITSARLVPPNEFDDPTLHALRRRIYLRLRRAVPELPVSEVFISDFSYLVE